MKQVKQRPARRREKRKGRGARSFLKLPPRTLESEENDERCEKGGEH